MAVEREDYDMAKALKQDIDKLRAAGEAAATGQIAEVPKSCRATDPEEIFNRVLGRWICNLPIRHHMYDVPTGFVKTHPHVFV